MSDKTRRILAIIAVCLLVVFTGSFIAYLYDRTLFGGAFGYVAIVTGVAGLLLYFLVRPRRDYTKEAEENEKDNDPNGSADDRSPSSPENPVTGTDPADVKPSAPSVQDTAGDPADGKRAENAEKPDTAADPGDDRSGSDKKQRT